MIAPLSERLIRRIQWTLTIGWLILILSLFYDPFSQYLTAPSSVWSPLRINHRNYHCPTIADASSTIDWGNHIPGTADPRCPKIQNHWVVERPYALGNRLFWTVVVAIAPGFLLIVGHSTWRRICPLSFLSQLPRALGWQQNNKISDNSWVGQYYWLLQFGGLYLGLTLRIILVNSSRPALGVFLILTIVSAMLTGLVLKGKTWCHYFCPFAPVQKILTGTGGLLEGATVTDRKAIPHSMCRTIDRRRGEVSACVNCKSACSDIDLEKSYWSELFKPGRRLAQYGYVGLIAGFYGYYFLYSGNWVYYFSGTWTHESGEVEQWWQPGLYVLDWAVPLPKVIAAPIVLAVAISIAYRLGISLERSYQKCRQRWGNPVSTVTARHQSYSIATFIAINLFYQYGGRPNLELLPNSIVWGINVGILAASSVWLSCALRIQAPGRGTARLPFAGAKRAVVRTKLNLGTVLAGFVWLFSLPSTLKASLHHPESEMVQQNQELKQSEDELPH